MPFRGDKKHPSPLGQARATIIPGGGEKTEGWKESIGRILAGGHARHLDLMMLATRVISVYGNLLSQALRICVPFCVNIIH